MTNRAYGVLCPGKIPTLVTESPADLSYNSMKSRVFSRCVIAIRFAHEPLLFLFLADA